MKAKQASVRGDTYVKLKKEAERRGVRISDLLSQWIEEDLDKREGIEVSEPSKKPKKGKIFDVSTSPVRGAGYHEF
jgi:hypothetical protein